MRFLWVDAGNDPNYGLLPAYGIDGLYFALHDPRVTKEYLKAVGAKGYKVGVYACWNWSEFDGKTPQVQAQTLHDMVQVLSWHRASGPKVQWNDERHAPDTILGFFKKYRELQQYRDTSWTLEGHQGGWMSSAFVSALSSLKVRIVPQCYNGDMTQVWDSLAMARDLTQRGFADTLISPFYDAKYLPGYWNGFAFTQGRLPQ